MADKLIIDSLPCYCCRQSSCNDGCMCSGDDGGYPLVIWGEANTRRIAAAPDMEAVIEEFLNNGEWEYGGYVISGAAVQMAKAALAKARGQEGSPTLT